MKMNLSFFLKTIVVTVAVTATLAGAQKRGGSINRDVSAAVIILKMEIERDKAWAKHAISHNLLRNVRAKLEKDLKKKEPLAKRLAKYSGPAIGQAMNIFISTTEAEKKISKGKTATDRVRRRTRYTLRDNIPKKEKALALFEKWSGSGR